VIGFKQRGGAQSYKKGYRFERIVMGYLWRKGYYVQRAYASKGIFDILAIPPKGRLSKSLAIQAKGQRGTGYCSPEERARLGSARKKYDAFCCIAFRDKEGRLRWRLIPPWW